MPQFDPELLKVLSLHCESYPVLKSVTSRLNLTLFHCLMPESITALDSHCRANPQLINEAVSLLEVTRTLSRFFSEQQDLVAALIHDIATARQAAPAASLQPELMGEYFVTSQTELLNMLKANPVYVGVYLYTLVTSVVGTRK